MQWYYAVKGEVLGPVTEEALFALARAGKLSREDLVWNTTYGEQWGKASEVPGLFDAAGQTGQGAWLDHVRYVSLASNRDLMAQARAALAGSWGVAVGLVLVYGLVQAAISALNVVPSLGALVGFVLSGPLTLGWYRFFVALSRGQPVAVSMLFDGFKHFGVAFLAMILVGLLLLAWMLPGLAVVGVALILGFKQVVTGQGPSPVLIILGLPLLLAVLIPAIVAQFRYSMTYFIINDRPDVAPLDAIRHSAQMMRGNKWKLFCLKCRFIGWGLLCLLTLGIGFLWLVPYAMTSLGRFYDELCDDSTVETGEAGRPVSPPARPSGAG